MKITNHRLTDDSGTPVDFVQTPNHSGTTKPLLLIIHYTAGISRDAAISWFQNPQAKASAHLIIDRDGTVVQMADFNVKTWHAGVSRWGTLEGLNRYSIGIELVNAGRLIKAGAEWKTWYEAIIPTDQVVEAIHKNESQSAGWHLYTNAQIEKAIEVGLALNQEYQFEDILGHDDIAPIRKSDPGPAFPLVSFSSKVLGRR